MTQTDRSFFDLYAQNFARLAVAIPRVKLAEPATNAQEIARLYDAAARDGAAIVLFPELALSGYSLEDLHQQEALLRAVQEGLASLVQASSVRPAVLVVGAPLRLEGRLFNCAVVLSRGRILGIVPKTYIPNYREFYEKRQFASSRDALTREVECLDQTAPLGADLLFRCAENPDLTLHVEICEDVWAPIPPSTYAALRGATVLANLSASNITIGKTGSRHLLAASQSGRCIAAYLYAAAGQGESTTDLAWDGHGMIYENSDLLAESQRFSDQSQVVTADVDLDRLAQERMRVTSFADCARSHATVLGSLRVAPFSFTPPAAPVPLRRLLEALGVTGEAIDIRPSCDQMLKDIGHPFAKGEKVYDVTFENVQAGERTNHLFRLANRHGALVVGTSDLSELALGWCTYGVGDQMAHYDVNASVPKTLIRHLIQWAADRNEVGEPASAVLRDVLATAISPELIPGHDNTTPAQSTEKTIGPYDLHDFSLYYLTRRGYRPAKVAYLEGCAFGRDVPGGPPDGRYTVDEIMHWQKVFLDRFFRFSQFKRSALPNAPKVGSGGSLSPRSDWRAPSDSSAAPWLADLEDARAWARRSLAQRKSEAPKPAGIRKRIARPPRKNRGRHGRRR